MRIIFLTCAVLLSFVFFAEAQDNGLENPFSLSKLKEDKKCDVLTVFKGEQREFFKVKLVEIPIEHPYSRDDQLVLVYMQGDMPVIAGMSGSPVYCDGSILGALAFRFGVHPIKEALAGITPIEAMRGQRKRFDGVQGNPSPNPTILPIPFNLNPQTNAFAVPAPLWFTNIPPRGFLQNSSNEVGRIAAGDSVTMFIARGDFMVGGTCTITEATSEWFSACGHAMLGEGEKVRMPAYRSSIATSFQSKAESYKLAGPLLNPAGTIVYDNIFGVEGIRQMLSGVMIPVRVSININGAAHNFEFEMIRHSTFSPELLESAMRSFLADVWSGAQGGAGRISGNIFFANQEMPFEFEFSGPIPPRQLRIDSGATQAIPDDPWQFFSYIQKQLASTLFGEWDTNIDRVVISLEINDK